jgi:CheY-like chemotaxis protein
MRYLRHVIIAAADYAVRTLVRRTIFRTCSAVTVSAVEDGHDALKAYERVGADLIITNHELPDMDGVVLTQTIRARDTTTPIVLLAEDATIEPQARRAGATQVLEKASYSKQLPKLLTQLLV